MQLWATEQEINQQPEIWSQWATELGGQLEGIRTWIADCKADEIWLMGAGTSAFIGDCIADYLSSCTGQTFRAIATTDLVSTPKLFLDRAQNPLIVSFGRSGNSSESIGVLDLLDHLLPQAHRLNITCADTSALATRPHTGPGRQYVITLPSKTLDEGFAMTSSYSTMLLTALACFDTMPVLKVRQTMNTLAKAARDLLTQSLPTHRPERAVFLGAGSLKGAMREAALKVLELTAGQVITSWDSTLGFRHGPKAIIKGDTSAFISLSSDDHSRQYDTDIVTEIKSQFPSISIQSLGSTETDADVSFTGTGIDAWDAVLHVLWSQRLAVAWSKDLDLNVDNPFIDHGNLTRVVAGVTLYTHQFG